MEVVFPVVFAQLSAISFALCALLKFFRFSPADYDSVGASAGVSVMSDCETPGQLLPTDPTI